MTGTFPKKLVAGPLLCPDCLLPKGGLVEVRSHPMSSRKRVMCTDCLLKYLISREDGCPVITGVTVDRKWK